MEKFKRVLANVSYIVGYILGAVFMITKRLLAL